jgi:hypothetical protein
MDRGARSDIPGTSSPAANPLAERLVKIGVLAGTTYQLRHWRFQYNAYVRLFEEPEASGAEESA